jgi:hypothetical protein
MQRKCVQEFRSLIVDINDAVHAQNFLKAVVEFCILKQCLNFLQAALLANGKVLIVGGDNVTGPLSSAEVYDPASGTWTITASMAQLTAAFSASTLTDGRVLAVGGNSGKGTQNTADIYDPVTGLWAAQDLLAEREYHIATVLADGRVLIAGGQNSTILSGIYKYDTAEVYSPCKSLEYHDQICRGSTLALLASKEACYLYWCSSSVLLSLFFLPFCVSLRRD